MIFMTLRAYGSCFSKGLIGLSWVEGSKVQTEQIVSALHLNAGERRL
jgi:hypothetical protein